MKKLLALLLLVATHLYATPFLVCPAVTAGVSNSPVTYTVSGLPNSPITSNAVTITSGTVQLDLDLGPSGQNVPDGSYTVSATATNPNGTSSASSNFALTITTPQALAFSGTGQHLDVSSALVSALPVSFSCWFKPASLAANGLLMSVSNTTTQFHTLDLYCNTSGKLVGQIETASGVSNAATSTASMSTGTWYQCSVVITGTSVTVYLNGTATAHSGTMSFPTGLNISSIGCHYTGTSTPQALVNGSVAYPTMWSSALTSTDETNLYNGGSGVAPNTIESGSVVSYSPFSGSTPWADGVSTNTWTTTGSPTAGTAPF